MKAFIALFCVAAVSADPQFFYNAPLVHHPLATPFTYLAKPIEMKKADEKVEKDEMKVETYAKAIKPIVYNTPYTYGLPHYTTYAHAAPITTYTTPLAYTTPVAKFEAVPRYHAKVGEVEHKVYKREAEPQFFYNNAFPYMYQPYFNTPLVKVAEKKAEEKIEKDEMKVETYAKAIKPFVYNTPYTYGLPTYNTYAHAAPITTYTTPLAYTAPIAKFEAVPRYQAKNGEVEHTVYKREADPQFFYNNLHSAVLPYNAFNGYAAPSVYSAAYATPYTTTPYTTPYNYYGNYYGFY